MSKTRKIIQYRDLGLQQLSERHFEEAIASFTKVLEIDPGNMHTKTTLSAVYKDLGIRQSRERHFEEAIVSFTKALEIDPGNESAHNKLAVLQAHHPQLAAIVTTMSVSEPAPLEFQRQIESFRHKVNIDTTYQEGGDLLVAAKNREPGARALLLERCKSEMEKLIAKGYENCSYFRAQYGSGPHAMQSSILAASLQKMYEREYERERDKYKREHDKEIKDKAAFIKLINDYMRSIPDEPSSAVGPSQTAGARFVVEEKDTEWLQSQIESICSKVCIGQDIIVAATTRVPGARDTLLAKCRSSIEHLREAQLSDAGQNNTQQVTDTTHLMVLIGDYIHSMPDA